MAAACDRNNGIERSADNVVRIPLPEDPPIACVRVQSGDTVVLPFDLSLHHYDDTLHMKTVDGFLVIEDEGTTIFLQGYVQTSGDDGTNSVVVTEANGTPIDVLVIIASSDPSLDILQ